MNDRWIKTSIMQSNGIMSKVGRRVHLHEQGILVIHVIHNIHNLFSSIRITLHSQVQLIRHHHRHEGIHQLKPHQLSKPQILSPPSENISRHGLIRLPHILTQCASRHCPNICASTPHPHPHSQPHPTAPDFSGRFHIFVIFPPSSDIAHPEKIVTNSNSSPPSERHLSSPHAHAHVMVLAMGTYTAGGVPSFAV